MKEAKGRITIKKSGNGGYKSAWIYIPSKIYRNDNFPFMDNEEVIIEIDDGALKIIKNDERSQVIRNLGLENATLPKLLETKAKANRNKPYLYFKDEVYSYSEMNKHSNTIAHGILDLISKLDLKAPKVSVLMESCPEFLFTWFGIIKAGCVFVPIDPYISERHLEHILKDSDTEILILDYKYFTEYLECKKNLPKIKKVFLHNAPMEFNFGDYFKEYKSLYTQNFQNPEINVFNDDPTEIQYSSGVTGNPKGVVYRNTVLVGVALGFELREIGLSNAEKIFCPIPLSSSTAHFFVVLPSIVYDKSLIITENFDASSFWQDVRKFEPTCFCYFTSHLTNLLYQKPQVNDRVHSIKFAYGFGAGTDLWKSFEERFGIQLHECWSHTEGVGVTINKLGSEGGKIGSIGAPLDFIDLKIVDHNGMILPSGSNNVGEIVVRRSSGNTFEYYRQPNKIDVNIDKDNWVHTGDFGYIDTDGYVYYKGKRSEIVSKGNEVIFTKDIERVANSHPNIIESSVIPVQNGNDVNIEFKIIAVKVKNHTISHKELSDFLFHNLAYFHVPRYIEIIEGLPKNSGIEYLKEVSKQEWEDGMSKNNTWDSQLKEFLTS
ncbi:MAG: AMP-binding protein [Promethearchaeota archaeon]